MRRSRNPGHTLFAWLLIVFRFGKSHCSVCLHRLKAGASHESSSTSTRLAVLTSVLLAPGIGFFSIVSILIVDGSGGGLIGSSPAQAEGETPQDMLAAQIRMQGVACDKALGAVRDSEASKPDHAVWILKCSNATYRVSRYPRHGC